MGSKTYIDTTNEITSASQFTDNDVIVVQNNIPDSPTEQQKFDAMKKVTLDKLQDYMQEGMYALPSGGIPKADMAASVQISLGKADTAIQSHQSLSGYATESWVEGKGYLTQHQSLAAYRTSANQDVIDSGKQATLVSGTNIKTINNSSILGSGNIEIGGAVDSVNGKTGTVVLNASDVGALPDDTAIPSKTSDITNDSGFITKEVSNLTNYTKTTDLPTKLSDFTDDLGSTPTHTHSQYLTEHQSLSAYRTSANQDVIDATKASASDVTAIQGKIPSAASTSNQLADKEFVNSSIATETAHYISNQGQPFTSVSDLPETGVTNNDYAYVTGTDASGNTYFDKYKATVPKPAEASSIWAKEYRLNNSSFTAAQWASISSGITSTLVASYNSHLANTDVHVTTQNKTDWNAKSVVTVASSGTATDEVEYITIDGVEKKIKTGDEAIWGNITGTLANQTDLNTALGNKVDKVTGKGLSTNDYDNTEKALVASAYQKPATGIPKTDLSSDVQTSLGKADTALQEHQSLSAYRTSANQDTIDAGKVDKVTGKGLSTNDYDNTEKQKVADNTAARHTHSNKTLLDGINAYLKDATLSADEKTLTLTKQDGSTVDFQGGGGAEDVGLTIVDGKLCITFNQA